MKRSSSPKPARTIPENYKVVAIACLLGIVITAVVLLLMAVVISSVDFPQSGIAPAAMFAAMLGCFGSGFICCHSTKSGGLLYGFICGSVIFLLSLLCELSILGGELGMLALYKYIICITSSMIGGVMGVNTRKKIR